MFTEAPQPENPVQPDGVQLTQPVTPVYLRPHHLSMPQQPNHIPNPRSEEHSPAWRQPTGEVVKEIVETLLLTLLIFWLVNAVIGRNRIEGPSMQPNFWTGEYLISSKLSYYLNDPIRGDVIVFRHPNNSGTNLIKRVIGLPGDTVVVRDQQVFVNGLPLDEPYINSAPAYSGEWHVPEGSYFVLGDNRNNSSDSHNWNFVPRENIIGKALAVLWPPDKWGYVNHYRQTTAISSLWPVGMEGFPIAAATLYEPITP